MSRVFLKTIPGCCQFSRLVSYSNDWKNVLYVGTSAADKNERTTPYDFSLTRIIFISRPDDRYEYVAQARMQRSKRTSRPKLACWVPMGFFSLCVRFSSSRWSSSQHRFSSNRLGSSNLKRNGSIRLNEAQKNLAQPPLKHRARGFWLNLW